MQGPSLLIINILFWYNILMPSRNIIKEYLEGGAYHIYNRGINRQVIFSEPRDYKFFLYLLKLYLSPIGTVKFKDDQIPRIRKNFYEKIDLLCYCLIPNHFHLLVKQVGEKDIAEFMRCVMTSYSIYFNRKYDRIGTLFQGRYKAVLIEDDNYLLHLSRYIHMNPLSLTEESQQGRTLQGPSLEKLCEYDYSSYADFLGKRNTKWIKPDFILDCFKNDRGDMIIGSSYKEFVENADYDSAEIVDKLILEELH